MKGVVVAKPGSTGCQAGKQYEEQVLFRNSGNKFIFFLGKDDSPGYNQNDSCSDCRAKVGFDVFNSDFCKNGCKGGKNGGKNRIDEPLA